MVVTCLIEFDNNPVGTYYAGQMLSGKITLQADKMKQVKGIVLKINGFAHTSWSETRSTTVRDSHGHNRTESTTVHYSGHEDYIASLTYLLGSQENQSLVIEPGIHTYNFACHLPNTCPSSFEGRYGHVRYIVKVVLIRPWKFDQTFTKGFTVLKVLDLNYDSPLLRVPCSSDAQKVFCCGPCKSGPLSVNVSLPQAGYVPGQAIPVGILMDNNSNVAVEDFKVELVMLVCYYSTWPTTETRNERIVVAKMKGERVATYCKKVFNYALLVPATPPTCFNLCRIIQVAYQLEVEAKVKGWHANQVICVPVTIGNVPLMGVIVQQPTSQMNGMQRALTTELTDAAERSVDVDDAMRAQNLYAAGDAAATAPPTGDNSPPTPWAAGANIPPPSYEAAIHMQAGKITADEAHDYGETEFTPRYPVFSIPNPTAPAADGGGYSNETTDASKGTWL